jgi:hypothetical protein
VKRVVVLLHERESRRRLKHYLIHALGREWQRRGLDVVYQYGLGARPEADLLFPHIDLTRIPADYASFINSYPRAVNRGVTEISKRRVSAHLLDEAGNYSGPVIVKTDNNCGGVPERRLAGGLARLWIGLYRLRERRMGPDLSNAAMLFQYPIYPNLAAVPRGAFRNSNLVVERFRPETEGSRYFLRHYLFLGDRFRSVRVAGASPYLKRSECVWTDENIPVPGEVIHLRRSLGLDYGKIDYTMPGGQVAILDVNRTVGTPGQDEVTAAAVKSLADGLWSYVNRE